MKETLEQRFLGKIVKTDTCWLWFGSKNKDGYGNMQVAGHNLKAHRVAYELYVAKIPEGLEIDHLCRVRWCVNPAHLEPVTKRENILRGENVAAKSARVTECPKGHPYDEVNTKHWRTHRRCRACLHAGTAFYQRVHRAKVKLGRDLTPVERSVLRMTRR